MLHSKSNLWIIIIFCTLNHGLCAYSVVDVGVVLDMQSWIGKSIHSSITMALSDFYAHNDGYKTRIVVDTRDSKGDQLQAMSHVINLVNTVKVNAIIGPETYIGSKQLALVADTANVPIFSFACKSSMSYHYLFQIKEDEFAMAKSVAALVESYKWRDVILVYEEDNDHGPEMLQYLFESFQDKNIRITYRSVISSLATDDQIIQELGKLMKLYTSVIIVHMSPLLASSLFVNAKMLGMMSKEYAWILTQKTIEIMHSKEFEVIESLQEVIGLRSYVPMSSRLHNLTKRWLDEFSREVPTLAIWVYDTIWALAESIERVEVPLNGSNLLVEILKTDFMGISGEFRLCEKKLVLKGFEIINMADYKERKVGYWTVSKGIRRAHLPLNDVVLYSSNHLEDVIWPGGSATNPKGWILRPGLGKTLRIGLSVDTHLNYFVDSYHDAQKNVTTYTGFSVDVFNTCIRALPYEVPYEFITFARPGFSHLITKVYNKELDGVLGDSTILANRSQYVDFTATYTDVGIGTLIKIKKTDFWIFLKPLDTNLWLTFTAFAILTGFTIWFIEAMDQDSETSPSQGIGRIFWLILSTIFFVQSGDKLSNNLSKFVMFVWLIVVLVLITGYTAMLTSLLTVEQFQLASRSGTVGFQNGSFIGVRINNLNFKNSRQYSSYDDYANALSKGGKHGGADAIVDEIPYIKMFLGRYSSNEYAMVSPQPTTSGFGFIFAKGSPLAAEMSREIATIREDGTLMALEKKWFEYEFSSSQNSFTEPKTLNLNRFGGLFIVLGVSTALSLIISISYTVRAKMEVESIISFLVGKNLMTTIRYLLYRNIIQT